MTWAGQRKLTYMSGVILFFGIIGFFVIRHLTNIAPTCYDTKKNGDETGVDCGGICLQYCPNELADPKVRWVRSFEVTPGIVHAVAYIEHSYPAVSAEKVSYVFKLYDDKNTLITERAGVTYLGPMGRSAIVETVIPTNGMVVATTRFAFTGPVPWEKSDLSFSQVVIKTDRSYLENYALGGVETAIGTRLTATLENNSEYSFSDMEVVAILYDDKDNAITTSKILVPSLVGESRQIVYFTWPFKISPKSVQTIEVIPRFNTYAATAL